MNEILTSMIGELSRGNPAYLPSKFWQSFNQKNLEQLESEGIANFKQTLALNYFTWLVGRKTDQFQWVKDRLSFGERLRIQLRPWHYDSTLPVKRRRQRQLTVFTRMLWKFTGTVDREDFLKSLSEPVEGNPLRCEWEGRLISQDLANSVLEYYSVREQFTVPRTERPTICELGAGYGRNGFVFLKAFPKCKYIIVDIPPALYVSQHYLTTVFPERPAFKFRPFDNFGAVEAEFRTADVVFLLPHQAEMLPPKSVNLFLNISSLHEMTLDLIRTYFRLIDRLTAGHFYSKQWKVSENPHDKIVIRQADYPVVPGWRQLFIREAKVQSAFFETMYAIPGATGA